MSTLIDGFAAYLQKTDNLGKSTLMSYTRDMELFFSKMSVETEDDCINITTYEIQKYFNEMKNEGKASSTILRNGCSVRKFFAYLVHLGIIDSNPAEGLVLPKNNSEDPIVLTTAEIDKILSMPKGADSKHLRDKAMLELMYAAGLKVSELILLDVHDVNLAEGYIYCRGAKSRTVPIGGVCVNALREYLNKARPQLLNGNDTTELFVNCRGSKMTRQGFWKILKEYISEAGIKKSITPQTLRHSFAMHLLQNGADYKDVTEMMGYNQELSVKHYSNMLRDRIKNTYNKAHPRA